MDLFSGGRPVGEVKVHIGVTKESDTAKVDEFAPDAVVVAIGFTPFTPDTPGTKGEDVISCCQALSGEKDR